MSSHNPTTSGSHHCLLKTVVEFRAVSLSLSVSPEINIPYLYERPPQRYSPIRTTKKNTDVENGTFHTSSHTTSHCRTEGEKYIKKPLMGVPDLTDSYSNLGDHHSDLCLVAEVPPIQTGLCVIAHSRLLCPVPVHFVPGTTVSASPAAAAAVGGTSRSFAAKFRRVQCEYQNNRYAPTGDDALERGDGVVWVSSRSISPSGTFQICFMLA